MSSRIGFDTKQSSKKEGMAASEQWAAVLRARWEELRAAVYEIGSNPDAISYERKIQQSSVSAAPEPTVIRPVIPNQKPVSMVPKTALSTSPSPVKTPSPKKTYTDAKRLRYTGHFVLDKHNKASQRVGIFATKAMGSDEKVTDDPSSQASDQVIAAAEARLKIEHMKFNTENYVFSR